MSKREIFEFDGFKHKTNFKRTYSLDAADGSNLPPEDHLLPDSRHLFGGSLNLLYFLLAFCLLVILLRSFYLQIVEGSYYLERAENNHIRVYVSKALRGVVYDSQDNLLVENIPRNDLALIPADLPKVKVEKEALLLSLFEMVEADSETRKEVLDTIDAGPFSPFPIIVKKDISHDLKLDLLSQYPDNAYGVMVSENFSRSYLTGNEMSHVLGYLGKITREEWEAKKDQYLIDSDLGKTGLELAYEEELKGMDGRRRVNVDAKGQLTDTMATTLPTAGCDLKLYLDVELQKYVREVLVRAVTNSGSTGGAVLVMNPQNGAILSMVSLPDFDNKIFIDGIKGDKETKEFEYLNSEQAHQPFLNRAVSGVYPPGSTYKLVTATAVLNEGIVGINDYLDAPGQIEIPSWFDPEQKFIYKDWKPTGHGLLNIVGALEESSDTFFYTVTGGYKEFKGLGLNKLVDYNHRFGLGAKLGIDLVGEAKGTVPNEAWKQLNFDENWYVGDTYNMAIGQGYVLTTPLQVASFTATVANKGQVYEPHLVQEILGCDNAQKIEPVLKNEELASPYTFTVVRRGMWEAVNGDAGTAKGLKYLNLDIAGKTGTAQFNNNEQEHAWFTGFAPFDDPEIVVTVLVEGGGEGSATAVPVAGEIFKSYFRDK